MQSDLFPQKALTLTLIGIPLPQTKEQKAKGLPLNHHIPSMKNCKMWVTKLPSGKPLQRPILISKPAYQAWREKAIAVLESQLLSACLITGEETRLALTRLSAICSQLPLDDSVNDLPQGSWSVQLVKPGEEGAVITLERL